MIPRDHLLPLDFIPFQSLHKPPYFESNNSFLICLTHHTDSLWEQGLCLVCLYSSAWHNKYLHQLKPWALRGEVGKGKNHPKSFLCVCRKVQCWQEYPVTAGGVLVDWYNHFGKLAASTRVDTIHMPSNPFISKRNVHVFTKRHVPVHSCQPFMMASWWLSSAGWMNTLCGFTGWKSTQQWERMIESSTQQHGWILQRWGGSEGSRPKNACSVIPMILTIKTGQVW